MEDGRFLALKRVHYLSNPVKVGLSANRPRLRAIGKWKVAFFGTVDGQNPAPPRMMVIRLSHDL